MIILRFRVVCLPDKTDQMMAALREVVAPARAVEGVISFDIARDLTDPNAFIATEVFQDEAARERQELFFDITVGSGGCGAAKPQM